MCELTSFFVLKNILGGQYTRNALLLKPCCSGHLISPFFMGLSVGVTYFPFYLSLLPILYPGNYGIFSIIMILSFTECYKKYMLKYIKCFKWLFSIFAKYVSIDLYLH